MHECPQWRAALQHLKWGLSGGFGPFMSIDTKGGLRSFAASAKSNNQREESGRSGYLPEFSVVQTQRMAAVSPLCEFGFLAACACSVGNAASA
jgi:hypothetical protein